MPSGLRYVGWVVTAAAIALFSVMLFVTWPHLAQLAGGGAIFDLRPLGYDFRTAQDLLARLGPDGAAYYEDVQHRIDSIFAILFCLALLYWLIEAARRWQGYELPLSHTALAAILATAVIANAADLGENAAVSVMLTAGAKWLTPAMVDTASLFTLLRTFFLALSLLCLLVLALGPWVARLMPHRK
ncbi:MAG TPA: hypothetical protein VL418_14570 [Devosiaceae bacterium]|nr:hypothetical protein [Devosiaceae bacterium]